MVGECRDGKEAVRALATTDPDLVFLDVHMPGFDGLDVIAFRGTQRMPLIVFVTAHEEYAVKAFEAQALDYLVKPLSRPRFEAMMERLYQRLRDRPQDARIAVPTADGVLLLDSAEVDWIEAQGDHAVIHAGTTLHRLRQPLASLEARLDPKHFARVHRSVIVRLDRVREVRSSAGADTTLLLRDGTEVPVSRRRSARIKARLRHIDRSPPENDHSPRRN